MNKPIPRLGVLIKPPRDVTLLLPGGERRRFGAGQLALIACCDDRRVEFVKSQLCAVSLRAVVWLH